MRKKMTLLIVLVLIFSAGYLFLFIGGNLEFALKLRGTKWLAILLTGTSIAISTVIFQTITGNRILTPSIMGLDSLYMLFQTAILFLVGQSNLIHLGSEINFVFSCGLMVVFSICFYYLLFKRKGTSIYLLLLVGIICGTFFSSFSSFMEMLIDPNEFQIVQDKSFAGFGNVNSDVLLLSVILTGLVLLYLGKISKYLDVLVLGREEAMNLGVAYEKVVKRLLIVVAILTSIATALVGPITFLGLIVSNIAYQLFPTHKHRTLIPAAALISVLTLTFGQVIAERIFHFNTPISVIINLAGGIYFLYLLLKGRKLV
ncbi:iron chelate uptake ABC transporter family permease subunit [Listeria aquatica]|uniref:Transport system permease n=1 Tax=Listeria aquatica FSL S10-1188 TaxID=1265818 RepID=W7BEC9_9LIST|nr:iron chelate uptake ABC transporter family permease subunit [Listeria aquatica]EUJ21481.1 transport system permease [Listeria aquatica FSL S10-1188]